MISLVDYRLMWATSNGRIPPLNSDKLFQYILAANGVFLHAERTGLEIVACLGATPPIRGLKEVEEAINFDYPPVPLDLTTTMLNWARSAKDAGGHPIEILFHLVWQEELEKWELHVPQQLQSSTSCKPVGEALKPGGTYERATIEVHSHHSMRAFFSGTDNADEQGFRVYGVLGTIFDKPTLKVRIGVYGQFVEVPSELFFDLEGTEVQDAFIQEQPLEENGFEGDDDFITLSELEANAI